MARVLPLDRTQVEPGETAFARFRLEGPLVAQPGDRFVIRSYSPIVTIGGGTLLDIDPPRFKRRTPALVSHLALLREGVPESVLEEHLRHLGAGGARLGALLGRVPFAPGRLRSLLEALQASGHVVAIDREWFVHRDAFGRLRDLAVAALQDFHRANPLRPGMPREELRSRAGAADERVFAHLVTALDSEGVLRVERDKVRLVTHEVRLSPEQQQTVEKLEACYLSAEAAPPSPEEALGRIGVAGNEEHELFQLLVEGRKLVRVRESLFFHARALDAIQDKLVTMLRERKEIGPGDIKDLLGISRKYAIPLLEFFDARRVTARVGERRVLRGG
jgi:selenocysteine-specific elongation factor